MFTFLTKTFILVLQEASETSESEYEEESEASSTESSEEIKASPAGPPQFVQKLMVFATGLRLLLSTMMNTAGKVVVTVLLGIAGITHKNRIILSVSVFKHRVGVEFLKIKYEHYLYGPKNTTKHWKNPQR